MFKFEIRSPKSERNPKPEVRSPKGHFAAPRLFGFRISDFGLRTSAWLLVVALALSAGLAAGVGPGDFAGSASCRECHEQFYQLWAPSHHGLAMQPYSLAATNLTPQKAGIRIAGLEYQADVTQGVVVERGPAGEKRYSIEQAMGGKNVFYFLTPLQGGRLQVLPVAYDLRRKEWYDTAGSAVRHFAMQPDEAAPLDRFPLHFQHGLLQLPRQPAHQ